MSEHSQTIEVHCLDCSEYVVVGFAGQAGPQLGYFGNLDTWSENGAIARWICKHADAGHDLVVILEDQRPEDWNHAFMEPSRGRLIRRGGPK